MAPCYLNLETLIAHIDEPHRSVCLRILKDHADLFQLVQGSSCNHQAWPGGYLDHVREVMNIGLVVYTQFHLIRPLPFSLSDVMLILFLHDIEKPWKYEWCEGDVRIRPGLCDKGNQREFRLQKLREYGIQLTPFQENGLNYIEGEGKDHSTSHRVMNPLAAFCHLADVVSARIWFDHPAANDPWEGAQRSSVPPT